jgi:hypothetical protein
MTSPSVTPLRVVIEGDASSMNEALAEGTRHLEAFGRSVDATNKIAVQAFRSEAESLQQLAQGSDVSLEAINRLNRVTQQFENQVDQAARRTAVGFESMSRGLMYVASTGNLAGRGMATVVAAASNVAFAFGSEGAMVGALTIGSLALYEFFDKSAARAEKLQKALDKVIDSTDRLKIAALNTEIVGQLQLAQQAGADPSQFFAPGQTLYSHTIFGAIAAMRDAQKLPGQAALTGAAEVRAGQAEAAKLQLDQAKKTLEDARSDALTFERELTKAIADGNIRMQMVLNPMLAASLRRAGDARSTLGNLISSPQGVGQLLHLNIGSEMGQLRAGDVGFADALKKESGQGAIEIAQRAANEAEDKLKQALKAVGDVVEKKTLENPFVASVLGVPLTKDAAAKYAKQMAESAKLMTVAGFGGPTGLENLTEAQSNALEEALRFAVARMPKIKHQLALGEQFTVPQSAIADTPTTGGFGDFLQKIYGGDDSASGKTKKLADETTKQLGVVKEAYIATYTAAAGAAEAAMASMIRSHKVSVKEIKKALGEPVADYLRALGIQAEVQAQHDVAEGNISGAILESAAALAAFAGSELVSTLMGAGGGGGGSGGGSSGTGSGSGSSDGEHRNAGAALGRGRDDGGTWQLEVVIVQKAPDGRELSRVNQQLQRLDDRNQPNRLVI